MQKVGDKLGKGKQTGKIVFSLAAFAVGFANPGMFGAAMIGKAFGAGMYAMSIASTIWSVAKGNQGLDTGVDDYSTDDSSKFDLVSNDISQSAVIPVVYGTRKWGGIQVWHNPYNSQRNLQKDVIVCEGGIQGVYNVCANDDLIKNDTNVSIYNTLYEDATVACERKSGQWYLELRAGKTYHEYMLQDVDSSNAQTSLLTTVIENIRNECGDGWKIDGAVNDKTSKGISANDIQFKNSTPQSCYCDPADPNRTNMVVLDNRGYPIGTFKVNDSVTPDNYDTTGGYTNTCWIRADLQASGRLSGGNPTINGYVQGRKVKVYRGGTWYTEYSENPAWIIRDFLTNKRFGCGYWISEDLIDDDSFKDVAAYCDELVTYSDADGNVKSAPRYKLNIVLDSQKKPIDWLSDMLAIGGLFIVINKKIALRAERAETPVYSFDDSTIVKDSMQITQTSLEETPNRYKIGYVDPSQNWTEVKVIVEDLEDQAMRDGKVIEKSISLTGCTSQNQALRVGRFYRDYNKLCSVSIAFTVATQGMMLECGDVINVSYGGIFTNAPFRITEIQETTGGTYQLTCKQYNASIYNDNLGATISMPSYTSNNSPYISTPPALSNLSAVEASYTDTMGVLHIGMQVSWDNIQYKFLNHYKIALSTDNGKTYKTYANVFDNNVSLTGLSTGLYYVSVQAVSTDGIDGIPAITKIEIVGKDTIPDDVTLLDTEVLADGTRRFWWQFEYPTTNDIVGFKLKYTQGNNPSWDTAFDLHSGYITAQPFETAALRSGTHTVMIKAVDNGGNESAHAAFCVLNLGDPLQDNILFSQDISANSWKSAYHDGVVNSSGYLAGKAVNTPLNVYIPLHPLASGQLWIEYEFNSATTVRYCLGSGAIMWSSDKTKHMWNSNKSSKMWAFNGIYKPYTGKVMVNSTDSVHLRIQCIPDSGKTAIISKLKVYVDVPDRVENFSNIAVPAAGYTLPIQTPYYYTTAVRINAIQNVNGFATAKIITRNPCKIQVVDSSGTAIAATCDLTWQGFTREVV